MSYPRSRRPKVTPPNLKFLYTRWRSCTYNPPFHSTEEHLKSTPKTQGAWISFEWVLSAITASFKSVENMSQLLHLFLLSCVLHENRKWVGSKFLLLECFDYFGLIVIAWIEPHTFNSTVFVAYYILWPLSLYIKYPLTFDVFLKLLLSSFSLLTWSYFTFVDECVVDSIFLRLKLLLIVGWSVCFTQSNILFI